MTEALVAVTLVLIAWLLGLLTPQIVERIVRRYRRPELMKSIALELDELRFKLITVRCNVRMDRGTLDRNFVEWAAMRAKEYQGVQAESPARKILIEHATYTDRQLAGYNMLSKRTTEGFTIPQRIFLPFLASQLGSMSILSSTIQRHLIEVLTRLEHYNAEVEKLQHNLMTTFDAGLSDANLEVIHRNMKGIANTLDIVALQIIDQADSLIPKMGL